jgi:hypothetical protein
MELKDLFITPLYLILIYAFLYLVRPYFTDSITRRYFIPGFSAKVVGAIALGLVYQFYYGGGDTFAFHTHGSRHIWEAFMNSPVAATKLWFANGTYDLEYYQYAKNIWYFRDDQTYVVIKIAALFDLLTISTYSATALFFALFSFFGLWSLFMVAYRRFPDAHLQFAIAALFIPSVVFWGSGILKDTITLGAIGYLVNAWDQVYFYKRGIVKNIIIIVLMSFLIYSIKKYIALSILPALVLWSSFGNLEKIKSRILKIMVAPFLLIIGLGLAYVVAERVGQDDQRYALDNLAQTAAITAYDIRYGWGARYGENSGYTLGELDGSMGSLIRLMPAAINVSLFRPYLWEARNPLMLLSALEALILFSATIVLIWKTGLKSFLGYLQRPFPIFCMAFSLVFAFAVGVSTFNFGTLARYKIPLLPFYLFGLIAIWYYSKSDRKVAS